MCFLSGICKHQCKCSSTAATVAAVSLPHAELASCSPQGWLHPGWSHDLWTVCKQTKALHVTMSCCTMRKHVQQCVAGGRVLGAAHQFFVVMLMHTISSVIPKPDWYIDTHALIFQRQTARRSTRYSDHSPVRHMKSCFCVTNIFVLVYQVPTA